MTDEPVELTEVDEDEMPAPVPLKPLAAIQDILADCEPGSLLTGVVVIAEWIDEDGDPSLGVIASPMSPWHMSSLFEYVKDNYCAGVPVSVSQYVDELDDADDDDFDDEE